MKCEGSPHDERIGRLIPITYRLRLDEWPEKVTICKPNDIITLAIFCITEILSVSGNSKA